MKPVKQRRFLVYTSAGDTNAIDLWQRGKRNFDLWVCYYNDRQHAAGPYEYQSGRAGGKFQNLLQDWRKHPEIFRRYGAILVMDDDIIIDAVGINRLFEVRDKYALSVAQPAFIEPGKISHSVTRRNMKYTLRYSNFVETTCPLFERSALQGFLEVYDGSLTGWGIDFWFLHVLRQRDDFRAAIIDAVTCFNPWDVTKGGRSEIHSLQPDDERKADWELIRNRFNIPEVDTGLLSGSDPDGVRRSLIQQLLNTPLDYVKKRLLLRRYKRQLPR